MKYLFSILLLWSTCLNAQQGLLPIFQAVLSDTPVEINDSTMLATFKVTDFSNQFNGLDVIGRDDLVIWRNCTRYEVDTVTQAFATTVTVRYRKTAIKLQTGYCALLAETSINNLGSEVAGLTNSDNQCIQNYYTQDFSLVTDCCVDSLFREGDSIRLVLRDTTLSVIDKSVVSGTEDAGQLILQKSDGTEVYINVGTFWAEYDPNFNNQWNFFDDISSTVNIPWDDHKTKLSISGDTLIVIQPSSARSSQGYSGKDTLKYVVNTDDADSDPTNELDQTSVGNSFPSSPKQGDVFKNTVTGTTYKYDGAWRIIASTDTSAISSIVSDSLAGIGSVGSSQWIDVSDGGIAYYDQVGVNDSTSNARFKVGGSGYIASFGVPFNYGMDIHSGAGINTSIYGPIRHFAGSDGNAVIYNGSGDNGSAGEVLTSQGASSWTWEAIDTNSVTGLGTFVDNRQLWSEDGADIYRMSNVGVGNNNPQTDLHVTGDIRAESASNPQIQARYTGGARLKMQGLVNAGYIGTENNFPLSLISNNQQRLTIDTDGNVGVNSTVPRGKVDVIAEPFSMSTINPHLYLKVGTNNWGEGNYSSGIVFGSTHTGNNNTFQDGSAIFGIQGTSDIDNVGIGFAIRANSNNVNRTPAVSILGKGTFGTDVMMGVNNMNPSYTLDVDGDGYFSNKIYPQDGMENDQLQFSSVGLPNGAWSGMYVLLCETNDNTVPNNNYIDGTYHMRRSSGLLNAFSVDIMLNTNDNGDVTGYLKTNSVDPTNTVELVELDYNLVSYAALKVTGTLPRDGSFFYGVANSTRTRFQPIDINDVNVSNVVVINSSSVNTTTYETEEESFANRTIVKKLNISDLSGGDPIGLIAKDANGQIVNASDNSEIWDVDSDFSISGTESLVTLGSNLGGSSTYYTVNNTSEEITIDSDGLYRFHLAFRCANPGSESSIEIRLKVDNVEDTNYRRRYAANNVTDITSEYIINIPASNGDVIDLHKRVDTGDCDFVGQHLTITKI